MGLLSHPSRKMLLPQYLVNRLPRPAGLAKHVFEILGGVYLAGLWKQDWYRGLLWNNLADQRFASLASFQTRDLDGSRSSFVDLGLAARY
jgi:hypothetical protein